MSNFNNSNGKCGDGGYKAETLENVQSYPSSPPPKQSKMKAHMRKFWWLHLISFILGTLLVNLLIIFVGMPNIAQRGINDAELDLESQVVTNPRPGVVHINMTTISHNKMIFHPTLDAFNASLFLENTMPDIKPFGYITIPKLTARASTPVVVDQELVIADQDQFAKYNIMVLNSATYRVAVRGKTNLHLGAFPVVPVNFNKVITSKGLNKLQGFRVQDINITLIPEADGTNMHGVVYLPNPSPLTLTMGTVIQNVFVGDEQIGVTTIPNLTLKPGDNYVPMTTVSNQTAVINLIATKYTSGSLPVIIKGVNATSNGQLLPYFSQALQSNVMATTLDLTAALKAIGLDVTAFGKPSTTTTAAPTAKL